MRYDSEEKEYELEEVKWDRLCSMADKLPGTCACRPGERGKPEIVDSAIGYSDSAIMILKCPKCGKMFSEFVEG